MTRTRWLQLFAMFLGMGLFLDLVSRLGAEALWFQEVHYLSVFWLKTQVRGVVWLLVSGLTGLYLWSNLALAQRFQHPQFFPPDNPIWRGRPKYSPGPSCSLPLSLGLRLRSLLPLTVFLSSLISLLLIYYGQLVWQYWLRIPNLPNTFVTRFNLPALGQFNLAMPTNWIWLSGLVGGAIALMLYPQVLLRLIAGLLTLGLGWLMSRQWMLIVLAWNPTPFEQADPLFGRDISFYLFNLPCWQLLQVWLLGVSLFGLVAVLLLYLLSGDSLNQGKFLGFSLDQQRHLLGASSVLMGVLSFSFWLSRYELLYSTQGVSFGSSYTDTTVLLPALTLLSLVAGAIALYFGSRSLLWSPQASNRLVLVGLAGFTGLLLASIVVPIAVQSLVVEPNELVRERPFIERTIAATRQAFGLEAIDTRNFNPAGQLTEADLETNALTIRNIRLWDQRPLLETNRQLQQIRPYYRFPAADIDRYPLQSDPIRPSAPASTEQRQVLISARELDYSNVPQEAQTWVNRHLIYTHGYGFTVSPVNTVAPGGLPEYFVKDIVGGSTDALTTASPAIRAAIPIGQPRIYYGELTNTYVMTPTLTKELDYPSGSDNVYNVYDGQGGINIGFWWRRGMFAIYLRDWRVIFTRNFLPETKVLVRRDIKQRIRAIAPFLRFDDDPYLVAARVPQRDQSSQNFLYWMVDAYTTSDRYPYSDPGSGAVNYIRNSVKVVVDAYHGSVEFYVADPTDPLIQTWARVLPGMFKPLSEMPANLRSHIRYPVDFFKLQSEQLLTYHMTDPQVFYNREDQWQISNEVYGSESRPVEPYYLITSLPVVPFEEFILLLPFTPRDRTNLIAWLAARSDGENYGKLLLYTFPKERLIYGPEQIEARINQDPVISQQISLWNRQGSRAVQGNLLIVPIERSLLYVEPLYLEATQNSLPTLVRVIVAYENRIVMAPTLEESLRAIFKPEVTPGTTIIRPVEDPAALP